jgi:RNA polymerase sigma-54 factor
MKQQLTQSQTLKMTPQQVLAIRLLELPIDELEQRIHEELESNFALDEGSNRESAKADDCADYDATDDEDFAASEPETAPGESDEYAPEEDDYNAQTDEPIRDDADDNIYNDYDDDYSAPASASGSAGNDFSPLSTYKNDTSFREDLENQLALRPISEEQRFLAGYIVESLDESGYLTIPLSTLVDGLAFSQNHETTEADMEEALLIVQDLDPAGIGARNLRECLLLQLRERRATEASSLAYRIIDEAFDDFSNKRYERLMSKFSITKPQLEAAHKVILSLHPKPADMSSEHDVGQVKASQATPDFIVTNDEGELVLSVNNAHIPPIHINQEYARMLDTLKNDKVKNKEKRAENKQGVSLIRDRINAAHFFIDALHQRRQTMTKVMKCIVQIQHEFFMTGDRSLLRPMVLNDVANVVGCDISTVSRAMNGKYVQTDFGVIAIKQLFTEAMTTASGDQVSNAAIQQLLERFIREEDKTAPLTDERLADLLKETGYPVARRTVAKYREQLGFSTARLRREV